MKFRIRIPNKQIAEAAETAAKNTDDIAEALLRKSPDIADDVASPALRSANLPPEGLKSFSLGDKLPDSTIPDGLDDVKVPQGNTLPPEGLKSFSFGKEMPDTTSPVGLSKAAQATDNIKINTSADALKKALTDPTVPAAEKRSILKGALKTLAVGSAGYVGYKALSDDDEKEAIKPQKTAPTQSANVAQPDKAVPEDQSFKNIPSEEVKKPSKIAKPEEIKKADEKPEEEKSKNEIQQLLDFMSGKSESNVEALRREQQRRDEIIRGAELQKAMSQIGAGIGSVVGKNYIAPDNSVLDQRISRAGQGIEDLKARIGLEDEDSQSSTSKGMQEFLKTRFGIQTNAPASVINKVVMPLLEKQEARRDLLEQRKAETAQRAEQHIKDQEFKAEQAKQQRDMIYALGEAKREQQKETAEYKKQEAKDRKITKMSSNIRKKEVGANSWLKTLHMQDALRDFKANPNAYTDFGTLRLGIQTLQGDDSVIREPEVAAASKAGGVVTKAINWMQGITTGAQLTDAQRKDIADAIDVLSRAAKKSYAKQLIPYYKNAISNELPIHEIFPTEIIPEIEQYIDKPESNKADERTPQIDDKNEVKRVTKDGKIAIFNKQTKEFLRYEGQ